MGRKCQITGKKANNAMAVSHSHRRTYKGLICNGKEFGGQKVITVVLKSYKGLICNGKEFGGQKVIAG